MDEAEVEVKWHWTPQQHPRDRHGRFLFIGDVVNDHTVLTHGGRGVSGPAGGAAIVTSIEKGKVRLSTGGGTRKGSDLTAFRPGDVVAMGGETHTVTRVHHTGLVRISRGREGVREVWPHMVHMRKPNMEGPTLSALARSWNRAQPRIQWGKAPAPSKG